MLHVIPVVRQDASTSPAHTMCMGNVDGHDEISRLPRSALKQRKSVSLVFLAVSMSKNN